MEEVLEVYKKPYDPKPPVVCLDESSQQLIKEVRQPISVQPGEPERYDMEYGRHGVRNWFIFFDPLAGWRHVEVTDPRTAIDWAYQIRDWVEVYDPEASLMTWVMDNLNTHAGASLYQAFEPSEARRILERLEIHYTPKQGSWLKMAEIELSILSRPCLDRRIPDPETLHGQVTAWANRRHDQRADIDWRFTTEEARIKLRNLYPTIKN